MKLKELNLLHFGKFHHYSLSLEDGLNVICGENEGGKSTIHAFIDGMFYGFAKPSTTRRLTDERYDRYRPWKGEEYRGSLRLEDEGGEIYYLERDFYTNEVKVLNETTGLDLSHLSDYYKYSRIAQPGVYFFNMSRQLFENSVYLRQLESSFDQSAAEALQERMQQFVDGGEEKISVQKALDNMGKELDYLGNLRRKNSLIGNLQRKLEEIYAELPALEENYHQYGQRWEKLREKEQQLQEVQKKIKGRTLYEKHMLQAEIQQWEEQMQNNVEKKISLPDYECALAINNTIQHLSMQLDQFYYRQREEENSFGELKIHEDFEEFRKIRQRIALLNERNFSKEIQLLSVDMEKTRGEKRTLMVRIGLALCLCGIILWGSLYIGRYLLLLAIILPIIYLYLRIGGYRRHRELLERLQHQMEELQQQSLEKTVQKKQYDEIFQRQMDKYGQDCLENLELFFERNLEVLNRKKAVETLRQEKEKEQDRERGNLQEEIEKKEQELQQIFAQYDVENIAELREQFERQDGHLLSELEKKRERLAQMDEVDHEVQEYPHQSLEELQRQEQASLLEISQLKGEISALEPALTRMREVTECKNRWEKELKEKQRHKESLELAKATLEQILTQRRTHLLPKLKERMEGILSTLTDGKYWEIFLTREYEISLFDTGQKGYVSAHSLSKGTVDELYLAFRLSIYEILWQKKFPLLLDEPFLQYDDRRMNNALCLLAQKEQGILFTGNRRELSLLENNGIPYRRIDL